MLTLVAIPIGFVVGRALCGFISESVQNDLYRIPLVLQNDTYAFAATVVLVASVVSGAGSSVVTWTVSISSRSSRPRE